MGNDIYGRFDHLVIELGPLDAARLRRRRIPVPLDAISTVRLAAAGRSGDGRVLVIGGHRHPAVVLDLAPGLFADRVVVHRADAADVVEDLVHRGVGGRRPERVLVTA